MLTPPFLNLGPPRARVAKKGTYSSRGTARKNYAKRPIGWVITPLRMKRIGDNRQGSCKRGFEEG